MTRTWAGLLVLLLAPAACTPTLAGEGVGRLSPRGEAYVPRAGDLVFYSDRSVPWRLLYALAHTGPPFHVGIVVDLPGGRPGVLEAGAFDSMEVLLMDLPPRLRAHNGTVWVRRLRNPLSPEQSARLTSFALAQTAKRYALVRLAREITPLRAHGPLGGYLFGSPRVDRDTWFCSELTVAAACVAGLLDPQAMRPNTVYPRDLFLDRPHDLRARWHEPALWGPGP
jgi:hypothetical protein